MLKQKAITIPAARETAALGTEQTNKVLRNTYALLAITMLPTIAGAFLGVAFPFPVPGLWGTAIFFVVIIGLSMMVTKNRNSSASIFWLLSLTLAMGYWIGPLIGYALGSFTNGVQLVAMAMGGTAAIFFTLAGYATVTQRDFSSPSIGKVLMIGLIMLIVVSLANLFFQIPALHLAISAVAIVIFSGYIIFTVNRIVRGGEDNYVMATMDLYFSLINIFISLLHLLMAFAGNRD